MRSQIPPRERERERKNKKEEVREKKKKGRSKSRYAWRVTGIRDAATEAATFGNSDDVRGEKPVSRCRRRIALHCN